MTCYRFYFPKNYKHGNPSSTDFFTEDVLIFEVGYQNNFYDYIFMMSNLYKDICSLNYETKDSFHFMNFKLISKSDMMYNILVEPTFIIYDVNNNISLKYFWIPPEREIRLQFHKDKYDKIINKFFIYEHHIKNSIEIIIEI